MGPVYHLPLWYYLSPGVGCLRVLQLIDSVILLGDLNAHVCSDSGTWTDVSGRNSLLNMKHVLLLDHSFSIMNTIFKYKSVCNCRLHQESLGCRSMIKFVIISSDLRAYVLNTLVKGGA